MREREREKKRAAACVHTHDDDIAIFVETSELYIRSRHMLFEKKKIKMYHV